MANVAGKIRFKAALSRPASPKGATWLFLVLPQEASAKLPTRSMTTVEGSFDGHSFQATLEPDGRGSHWLKVPKALRDAAGVDAGDTVALEIAPVAKEPEPRVPADLARALAARPAAQATWADITPLARRDWIHWITSGKKAETRGKRIDTACDKLASGQRRACCFDRSGIYSKGNMGAPKRQDRRGASAGGQDSALAAQLGQGSRVERMTVLGFAMQERNLHAAADMNDMPS